MADRLYRAQVTIPMESGIPEDAVVNTFYFDDDDDALQSEGETMDQINGLLEDFYTSIGGNLFSSNCASGATVRYYDMRDPEPRALKGTSSFALPQTAGNWMPKEVALCASFKADTPSGVNPARRRGRVYLGPCVSTAGEAVGSEWRPTTTVIEAVRDAMETMAEGVTHSEVSVLRCRWAVYSPTTDAGGATIDDSFFDVVAGWVDDSFDTQRRRGSDPTRRVVFPS